MDRFPDIFFISLPCEAGDHHIGAHRDPDEEIDHQTDDGRIAAHRCHRVLAGEAADDCDVRGIKKLLQNPCRSQRKRKHDDFVTQGSVDQIHFSSLCHFTFSFCPSL